MRFTEFSSNSANKQVQDASMSIWITVFQIQYFIGYKGFPSITEAYTILSSLCSVNICLMVLIFG